MLTRRRFLSGSCALGVAAVASPLVSSARTTGNPAHPGYRAIVCILLGGGNDSFNMLVPHGRRQYNAYQSMRGDLALERRELLELPVSDANGYRLALHPGMQELHELYSAGRAAIVTNVGTLSRPLNVRTAHASLPVEPMAHAAQLTQWQSCGLISSSTGWAGRIADLMQTDSGKHRRALNLSLSGNNILQIGDRTSPVQVESASRRCPQIPAGVDFQYLNNQLATQLESPASRNTSTRFARSQRYINDDTLRAIAEAPALPQEVSTLFADDPLSRQLADVTRIIAARSSTAGKRQIFFVQFDGWDHHHELLRNQAVMLPMLSGGLKSFHDALQALEVLDDVTTFTTSEFGRSLVSNGSGSDHGWGGNQIVMGGSVNGGNLLGDYPEISTDSPLHIGGGTIAPTTANEEYFAELALWLGLPPAGLLKVFPNLGALRKRGNPTQRLGLFT